MKSKFTLWFLCSAIILLFASFVAVGQETEKTDKIIAKAIIELGGDKYLNAKTMISEGTFSVINDGINSSYQTFTDIIVFPDWERTDLSEGGWKSVQVNQGKTGWIYQEKFSSFRNQDEKAIKAYNESVRSHYDYLLRGDWKEVAKLSYAGRRSSTLGKRNDVLKLTFEDGFEVEYEFADDGLPMKSVYIANRTEPSEKKEETRFNRFTEYQGIQTPTVIDRYTNDVHFYRVVIRAAVYNKKIPDKLFVKPSSPKKIGKTLKI